MNNWLPLYIRHLRWPLLLLFALFSINFFTGYLTLHEQVPDEWIEFSAYLSRPLLIILFFWIAWRLIDLAASSLRARYLKPGEAAGVWELLPLATRSLQLLLLVIGSITLLGSFDVDVAGLITGFGISGIAIALAAKDGLAHLLGSLTIMADHPFRVGDEVVINDKIEGRVEKIGFRSTRLRDSNHNSLFVPNGTIANATIVNKSRKPS